MSKKIVLYEEATTNKVCGLLVIDGNVTNLGPVTSNIIKEYKESGYELDWGGLPEATKTKITEGFGLVRR